MLNAKIVTLTSNKDRSVTRRVCRTRMTLLIIVVVVYVTPFVSWLVS